jgi:predicted nucleotidyltransferase
MRHKKAALDAEKIIATLEHHRAILKKYNVVRIGLFGSYAKGKGDAKSDIDFLVEFKRPSCDGFLELIFRLEEIFGKRVDLITKGNLSPYMQPYVSKEVQWYEA